MDVGDDWIHTSPFTPIEKDGYLIGRGVLDDKSAIVTSLDCAKMLKELNIPFNSKLVMFTGANEETGMDDIEEYSKHHTAPDFSLACDTAFPLYRGDKSGMNLRFGITADVNIIKKKISDFCEKNNCTVEFEEVKKGYILPKENKYVKACLNAYSKFTRDKNPPVYINAGGTYARKLPCASEIGTTLIWGAPKNTPDGHGGAHQPDECIHIEGFLQAIELTALMILECDKLEK